jgi:VWFA-related protein
MVVAAVLSAAILAGSGSVATQSAGQTPPAPQVPTFRSSAVAVPVEVSVRDKARKAVVGLTAKDFKITDNGIAQEISEISYGTRPIDVTIGLDVSASVTGDVLDALRRAVVQLMGDLKKDDRLKLLLFNSELRRAVDFTTDVKAVENAMRRVPAGGGTALHDTLSVAMVGASDPDRRQLVMFFTDGIDSGSAISTNLLETVAQRTRATLTFVVSRTGAMSVFGGYGLVGNTIPLPTGPGQPGTAGRGSTSPRLFDRLAAETGGAVLFSDGSATLGSTFRRILDEFRSTYVLFYSPKGVERPGFHTIAVEVARPDVIVQARRGYFGG